MVHSRGLEGPGKAVVEKQSEQTYDFLDCVTMTLVLVESRVSLLELKDQGSLV